MIRTCFAPSGLALIAVTVAVAEGRQARGVTTSFPPFP